MAKSPRKSKKDNSLRNAIIAFGVTMLGYSSLFSFRRLSDFLIGSGISLLVATLVKAMTAPMKGIDAPKTSDKLNPENVQDDYAKSIIVRGMELLSELRRERDTINEYVFTRRLNDLINGYTELLNKVVADHDKASHLRKLNSYYIPTAVKLLQSYREAKSSGTSYMEISATREDILESLDQLITATQTLKKKMLRSKLEAIDIKCEVLEDILKADGYIEDEATGELRASAEKAAKEIPMARQMTPVRPGSTAKSAPAAVPVPLQEEAARPNTPTASAASLRKGAPVLQMPGMTDIASEEEDCEQSRPTL